MAAVWGAEGEVEGTVTGAVAAAATEWKAAEVFLTVSGFRIALRIAVAAERLKVEVTPLPLTDHKFENEFDEEALRRAGFGLLMPFLDRFQVIRGALKGDESMTATLTLNGSDAYLHITVAVAYFLAKYKLSLRKVPVLLSDKLSMDVIAFKQQLADVRLELEQTKAELREAVSDGDSVKQKLSAATQELATSTQRVSEVLKETAALKSQLAKAKAQAATERRSMERKRLSECRAAKAQTESQLSDIRLELGQMKAALMEAVSDGDSAKQTLATATVRVAKVSKETAALKSQLAKAATERRSAERALADLRADFHATKKQLSECRAAKTKLESETDALTRSSGYGDSGAYDDGHGDGDYGGSADDGYGYDEAFTRSSGYGGGSYKHSFGAYTSAEASTFTGDSVVLTRGTVDVSRRWYHSYGRPDAVKLTNEGVDFYLRGVGTLLCDGITTTKVQIKMGGKVVTESKLETITGKRSKKTVELKLKKAFLFKKGHVIDVVLTQKATDTDSWCCLVGGCSTELTAMGGIKVKVSDSSESKNRTDASHGALPCFYIGGI